MDTFKSDHYPDGRTKQAFKDSTDINKILVKAQKGDTISHLAKHGAVYGDFSDIDDLLTAQTRLATGQRIFDQLPGEIRREFEQSPAKFYNYVNDPANADQLANLLPGLAERGNQLQTIVRSAATMSNIPEPIPTPVENTPPAQAEGPPSDP